MRQAKNNSIMYKIQRTKKKLEQGCKTTNYHKKHTGSYIIPADSEEKNCLQENNPPKDLKSKR